MTVPRDLARLVPEHRALADYVRALYPDEMDEQAIADTIEGLSALPEALGAMLRLARREEAEAKACRSEIVRAIIERAKRKESREAMLKAKVAEAMGEAGLKRLSLPDMTVTLGHGSHVIITDEAALPDEFCKTTREPVKSEIAKALKDGREVPGAEFSNAAPFLAIRKG